MWEGSCECNDKGIMGVVYRREGLNVEGAWLFLPKAYPLPSSA